MNSPDPKDLLLAPRLDPKQVATLLSPYGIKDPRKADANLQAMADDPSERPLLAEILEELLECIAQSADPDQAITYLERFSRAALNKVQLFTYLKDSPRAMEILARTLGGSPYMAEILIRDPQHFYWVTDPPVLYRARAKRTIQRELVRTLKAIGDERTQLDYLRFLKRREMLHVGVRDLLRLCTVEETLVALTAVAEALISAAYWICASALRRQCAIPDKAFSGFAVLAMGKLGGGELNFSSDVDLMYLYASDQEAAASMTAAEYFSRLCRKLTAALNDFTSEGYMYRVDLRLRPEGKAGYIAYSLDGFQRYYETRAGTWERLALLKAWPVAGNRALAEVFLKMVEPVIYHRPFDDAALEEVRNMKRQIDEQMAARDQRTRNVKLGTGGIREIEIIAQSLQVRHGKGVQPVRERNTLRALRALSEQQLLSTEQCDTLTRAYLFLRDVENKLQMTHDAQTHSLPRDPEQLATFVRLLGYTQGQFVSEYEHHTRQVNRIFDYLILSGQL